MTSLPPRHWLSHPLECGAAAGFGLYLHVPFCAHRCGYCDFATWSDQDALTGAYVAALQADLVRTASAGPAVHAPPDASLDASWPPLTSVFVGGGTPTRLPAADLVGIIDTARSVLPVTDDAEITVETNPEDASADLYAALHAAGVTRLSIGAQSLAPHVLQTLERGHDPDHPLRAVELARTAGIPAVNLDLIYGTPGETAGDWADTLNRVVAAGVDHVSAYALTIHANTPFGARVRRGTLAPPDPDRQRRRFDVAREVLAAAGFDHYELSNWARSPAQRSRHNLLYWRHGDYLGIGVGAHGHLAGRRWWSHRSIPRYVEAVEHGASPVAGSEILAAGERAEERLLLGLRLRNGLHATDVPPLDPATVAAVVDAGLLTTACGRLQATEAGWYLLDETVQRLEPAA